MLPVGVQGTRRPEGQRHHQQQAGGRSWKEDFSPNKERPLDLSGPRARLYMPVDKVVAGCGKGGPAAFEGNTQRSGRGSSLEVCSRAERTPLYEGNPRQEIGNRNPPFRTGKALQQSSSHHAPPGQYLRQQHRASTGPLQVPGGVYYQPPNRSTRLQPRFPVEKKGKKLPAFKSVSSEKAATLTYSMCQPPAPPRVIEKPDFLLEAKPNITQVEVAPDSFDLLDQLEVAVAESLGVGKEMVAKAVADSWRNQVGF